MQILERSFGIFNTEKELLMDFFRLLLANVTKYTFAVKMLALTILTLLECRASICSKGIGARYTSVVFHQSGNPTTTKNRAYDAVATAVNASVIYEKKRHPYVPL